MARGYLNKHKESLPFLPQTERSEHDEGKHASQMENSQTLISSGSFQELELRKTWAKSSMPNLHH